MSVAVASGMLLTDGDAAFLRVNNRAPAHALAPGEVARAVNCRFDQGKPRPRHGVAVDEWGLPGNLITAAAAYSAALPGDVAIYNVTLVAGHDYVFVPGNGSFITPLSGTTAADQIFRGRFTATETTYVIYTSSANALAYVTAKLISAGHTCAYGRFSDPLTNTDNGILLTDDWRDGGGEDGGRGRAWRILPENVAVEIPLNGHDVWGASRLVQCANAMLLLRANSGNQRYYFSAAAFDDATNDRIQLNVTPPWALNTGRRVRFALGKENSAVYGTSPPAAENYYFAKHITGDKIELYTDAALTNKLNYSISPDAPTGAFFIEEAENPVPFFGNGARNLILQPDETGRTAFEVGFDWVLENVAITDTVAATHIVTAPNHRLQPGDSVTGTTIGGVAWPKFAAPQSAHTLKLYNTAEDAQVDDGTTGLVNLTTDGQTGSLWKTSAAAVPLPPLRAGAYVNGRLIGINEQDTTLISDPHDFLHCSLWQAVLPANQGESGRANWIAPLGDNVVVVGKDLNVIGIAGLSGDASGWSERVITREYNGLAPLAVVARGTDLWFASRKGLASVIRTVAGETLGSPETLSRDIPDDLKDVDWSRAGLMCAEVWNDRLFWSVPTRGQETPVNNKTLVLNFRNARLRVDQTVVAGDVVGGVVETNQELASWEGTWEGALLTPYAYARLTIGGEERLTFATPDGLVCWLHDGWDDTGTDIASELLTRGYFGGRPMLALRGKLNHDTFQPSLTVTLVSQGVNEETTLAGFNPLTYDRTQYNYAGHAAYDPSTATEEQFNARGRQDYSPADTDLAVATLDTHQNTTEGFYCRERVTAPQVRYVNAQGSARLCAVALQGKPIGVSSRES